MAQSYPVITIIGPRQSGKTTLVRSIFKDKVDLIFKSGNNLIPVEIKSSQTFTPHFLDTLKYFKDISNGRCKSGYLIYAGDREQQIDIFNVLNFTNIEDIDLI